MTTLANRIEQQMREQGLTQESLAKKANISQSAIHKLISGKSQESRKIAVIAAALKVNTDWLATGIGEKYAERQVKLNHIDLLGGFDLWDEKTPLREDEVALHFFKEVELSAGNGISEIQENYGRKLRFSKATLKSHNVDANNAACVIVTGNSMEPVIPTGSTIGIDTSKKKIIDSDIYAINHDGNLRIKIIYKIPGGGLRLRSFNAGEWPDEIYNAEASANIRILGRVFWWSVLR